MNKGAETVPEFGPGTVDGAGGRSCSGKDCGRETSCVCSEVADSLLDSVSLVGNFSVGGFEHLRGFGRLSTGSGCAGEGGS